MTLYIPQASPTASFILPDTKPLKIYSTETSELSPITLDILPKELQHIILQTIPMKNRLDMLTTSTAERKKITILSKEHLSIITSKYYSLPKYTRPCCSIVDRLLEIESYPLDLRFQLKDMNNIPTEVYERNNLSIHMVIIGSDCKIDGLNTNVLRKVKTINANYSSLNSQSLAALLEKCPELQELNIASCPIQDLNLSNISSIKIKKIFAADSTLNSQSLVALLEKCPEIESLDVRGCRNVQDLINPSNISSIKVKKIYADKSSLTSQALTILLEKCPELQELSIANCPIQDLNLSNIASTKIKTIYALNSALTSQGLIALLEKCPELASLNIRNCKNIQRLNISFPNKLDPAAIKELLDKLKAPNK